MGTSPAACFQGFLPFCLHSEQKIINSVWFLGHISWPPGRFGPGAPGVRFFGTRQEAPSRGFWGAQELFLTCPAAFGTRCWKLQTPAQPCPHLQGPIIWICIGFYVILFVAFFRHKNKDFVSVSVGNGVRGYSADGPGLLSTSRHAASESLALQCTNGRIAPPPASMVGGHSGPRGQVGSIPRHVLRLAGKAS